ncbi:UPF0147 family protein [Candidatus Woesearchaeota archaeon]|nr:UPF0147 family protein [Candidatus Woesearchaeota archaeon]MBW3005870.1 UPF0147 family protein [Candidatus Woesearchaeota archaeon]
MNQEKIATVIALLREVEEDTCVPKNVKNKISITIKDLETSKEETSIKISRALHALEELTEDNNMQADTRTQLFNIVSTLEIV